MKIPHSCSLWITLFTVVVFLVLFSPWKDPVQAGCQLNVYVVNKSNKSITIKRGKLKIKGGFWKIMKTWGPALIKETLKPGQKAGAGYKATFNCGKRRRYQILYMCLGGPTFPSFTDYYPSTKSWTTNRTVVIPLPQCK